MSEIVSPKSVEDRVYRIVAELFTIPIQNVTLESSPDTIAEWDSVGHLNLVLTLEKEFGVRFSTQQIDQLSNVRKIVGLLAQMNTGN